MFIFNFKNYYFLYFLLSFMNKVFKFFLKSMIFLQFGINMLIYVLKIIAIVIFLFCVVLSFDFRITSGQRRLLRQLNISAILEIIFCLLELILWSVFCILDFIVWIKKYILLFWRPEFVGLFVQSDLFSVLLDFV